MEIISPRREEHLDTLSDVFARSFSDYWAQFEYAKAGYFAESPYDWEASRVGVADGRVVTHFGVWDFRMRVGRAVVRLAGIGAVATLKTHRGRGLMAGTADDCVRGMDAAGYDVSLLFGIPGFYHRFGYVSAFGQVRTVLRTRDVVPADGPIEYALYEGPPEELAELYNRENESVTGTYVRPTYRINRMPARFTIYRFDGGYVVGGSDGATYQVADCAGDPATIVEIARQRARADVCPEVEFVFAPPRSRIGEHLRTLTHRTISDRHRDGGPMMKIVNLARTLEKIAPELTNRLAASPLSRYSGTLAIHGETAALVRFSDGIVSEIARIDGAEAGADAGADAATDAQGAGAIRAAGNADAATDAQGAGAAGNANAATDANAAGNANAATGFDGRIAAGPDLVRLVVGDGDPHRVCRQAGIELTGDARHLVPILFPDQEPSTILWDRF